MTSRLNYEKLVADYITTLKTELRHFSTPEPFLDMWVPDGDDAVSILNLIESAAGHHLENLSLEIGEETLKRIDLVKLLESLNQVSITLVRKMGKSIVLEISLSKRGLAQLEFADVPIAYHRSVSACGVSRSYQRSLQKKDPWVFCENGVSKVILQMNINPHTHIVEEAAYSGAVTPVSKYLLDQLCRILAGKPVNECHDHAVIRLEYELRDKTLKRPNPGITLPSNSWGVFKDLNQLVRSISADYRQKTSYNETKNFFVQKPSEQWTALPEEEKRQRLVEAIEQFCREKEIDSSKIRLENLLRGESLIISADREVYERRPHFLLELEYYLKRNVERELSLWTPEESDKNKIRWNDAMKTAVGERGQT